MRKRLLDALRQTFRPEFLNRVDDIIVFNTLSKEHLSVIIDLQLGRVEKHAGRARPEARGDPGGEGSASWRTATIRLTERGRCGARSSG